MSHVGDGNGGAAFLDEHGVNSADIAERVGVSVCITRYLRRHYLRCACRHAYSKQIAHDGRLASSRRRCFVSTPPPRYSWYIDIPPHLASITAATSAIMKARVPKRRVINILGWRYSSKRNKHRDADVIIMVC